MAEKTEPGDLTSHEPEKTPYLNNPVVGSGNINETREIENIETHPNEPHNGPSKKNPELFI